MIKIIIKSVEILIHFKYFLSIYSRPGDNDKEVILLSWSLQSSKESKDNKRKYFTFSFVYRVLYILQVDSVNDSDEKSQLPS